MIERWSIVNAFLVGVKSSFKDKWRLHEAFKAYINNELPGLMEEQYNSLIHYFCNVMEY